MSTAVNAQPVTAEGDPLERLVADYVMAWNAGDVEALGRLWTADGELINTQGVAVDRKALLAAKSAGGEGGRSVLSVKVGKTRLLEPNVAMVDGETSLATSEGSVFERMRFSGVLVKQDGAWRIRLIHELSSRQPAPEEPLKDLAWLLGEWVGMGNGVRVHVASQLDMGNRYIMSRFEVEPENGEAYEAVQRIGWDPETRSIKSWFFDSRGSISSGAWEKNGDHWLVAITGTQYDGESISGTSAITRVDDNSYLRTLANTRVGGEAVPDQELRIFRVTPQPTE